ncbi:MAG: sn-glycerol-3-phosphate ABC transporter ATP-binding protein UgpC [Eubacteriales bacterium]|nr:sn-glycerol-3-phosphate ABC transporter ATP-binding protein UgpC [Clostridiales bacterium]MDY5836587.1 sn-glycerol-3-phosphate ABC transporter ATP-binding protein UgpC [Eubacteriales bacterium]
MAEVRLKDITKVYPLLTRAEKKEAKAAQDGKTPGGLIRTADGVVAVHELNLDIADKEFIVLVGPSGCGKSTTLRMVAGLEEITSGELYIDGKLMNDVAPKDRDIAMVFQSYALYPHMTVYDNMAFSLQLRKESKEEIDRKVKEAAEILDITEYLNRKPKALSGGQRQRVAIGRAIVRDPKVFLMDEPLSNLDAKLRNQMRAEIIQLRQRIETTFIYVTHDQTEAITLGDRIVIMKDGFIQQVGTPAEVFNQPKNIFVAGFIGTPQMNFFKGKLNKDGSKYNILYAGQEFPLSPEISARLADRKLEAMEIEFGVRPEHIVLTAPNATQPHVKASVRVSEMMGSSIHLHVKTVDGDDAVIVIQTVDLNPDKRFGFKYEDEINFTFGDSVPHLFNPVTGENLIY